MVSEGSRCSRRASPAAPSSGNARRLRTTQTFRKPPKHPERLYNARSRPPRRHQMTRHLKIAAAFLIALGGLGLSSTLLEHRAAAQAKGAVQAPRFEVDPLWPKPLPNKWILGQTIGVSVDAQDHVWIIHRAGSLKPGEAHATTRPQTAQCCAAAPPILEFDAAGNLIGH